MDEPSHGAVGAGGTSEVVDLVGPARERALGALRESFTGVYRWHAKRTLQSISTVRAVEWDGEVVAAALLERFDREVAYVYYLFVAQRMRGRGLGRRLLDDALDRFRRDGAVVVYAACGEDNVPSLRLFESRGFRRVGRDEPGFREGGLGARGYRSRMWVVRGETLLGRRLAPAGAPPP